MKKYLAILLLSALCFVAGIAATVAEAMPEQSAVGCVEYWPGWCTGYSTAAETRKAIIANVERLWTYYKETYQEDERDD